MEEVEHEAAGEQQVQAEDDPHHNPGSLGSSIPRVGKVNSGVKA